MSKKELRNQYRKTVDYNSGNPLIEQNTLKETLDIDQINSIKNPQKIKHKKERLHTQ